MRNVEFAGQSRLDLGPVELIAQELPHACPGAIEDVDLVSHGMDKNDLISDAGGERIGTRAEARRRGAGHNRCPAKPCTGV